MPQSNIIMYTTEDGITKIEVTFDHDTVWLSIDQMAELFQRALDDNRLKNLGGDALNKIITAYLDIAEVHALNQDPMYMRLVGNN